MLVLGIETSCDDTSVALLEDGAVLANEVASQFKVHEAYGGVVPELAARAHLENLPWVLDNALEKAGKTLSQIDLIAVTAGPGLQIALLVGVAEAKGLALGLGKPLVAVNHLRAHLEAPFLAHPKLPTPTLALLVSGGHSSLVLVEVGRSIRELGRTRDDAAGECFDKVARALNLPGAGGPAIQNLAEGGDPKAFALPRPRVKGSPYDFSFSGLKTKCLRTLEDLGERIEDPKTRQDFAASFQAAVVESLSKRVLEALKHEDVEALTVTGGVAANGPLQARLEEIATSQGIPFFPTPRSLCTDNAAMIAAEGLRLFQAEGPDALEVQASAGIGFRHPRQGRALRAKP